MKGIKIKVIQIKSSLYLLATLILITGCLESNTVGSNANTETANSFGFSDAILLPASEEPVVSEIELPEVASQVQQFDTFEDLAQAEPSIVASNRSWITVDAPLVEVRVAADARLNSWLSRPSELPVFDIPKPLPPIISPPATLVKSEFETTFQFEERIKVEQLAYDEAVEVQIKQYESDVKEYNDSVAAYKQAVQIEKQTRQAESEDLLWQLIYEELQSTLGQPFLQNAIYDADTERFLAELVATDERFSYSVTVDVPLEVAPAFKQNLDQATPLIAFALDDASGLAISDMAVQYDGDNYTASIFDSININADKLRILKARNDFEALRLDEVNVQ